METILKVGDPARGFKLETVTYKYIKEYSLNTGRIGEVAYISDDFFTIMYDHGVELPYPIDKMHLAVVEEQPKVIEIDMSKVENYEAFNGIEWSNIGSLYLKYRITMKDENKLKIQQDIEELEEKIKELKLKLK